MTSHKAQTTAFFGLKQLVMSEEKFSFLKRAASFKYAFNGLNVLWKEEHNSRIHVVATGIVISLGFAFQISMLEWCALLICIGFVLVLEIVNSAIENLCDLVSMEPNKKIMKVKDLAAASVFIAATISLVVGAIIFLPKLLILVA